MCRRWVSFCYYLSSIWEFEEKFIQNKFLKFSSILIFRKLMTSGDPETNKGLALKVAMKLRKTFQIWTCYNFWGVLMCWVSLERSPVIWSVAERKTFVEFQDFLVLVRALAGLGCGIGAVQVGGGGVGWVYQFWARHWEICIPGFIAGFEPWIFWWRHQGWCSCSVLAQSGWSRSLGLGWSLLQSWWGGYGGLAGFFCFPVGRMLVPLFGTLDIFTLYRILSKYSIL